MTQLSAAAAAVVFLAFAFAYFFSALLRAVTATLAPVFSSELGLHAGDLGLLAGAYFFGFAVLQLPLGRALDRFGPRRTLLSLLTLAVAGCAAFAMARDLPSLIAARMLIGAGVAAALMAPLTCYRRMFSPGAQLRANSWMLMTGSFGMVASTVPVQLLLPQIGWRGLFWAVAGLLVLACGLIAWLVPRDTSTPHAPAAANAAPAGYRGIVSHPLFMRSAPIGFFIYGGLVAVQSLWAGPWLTRVSGFSATQAAQGLFAINLCMLVAFGAWGVLMPRLAQRGISAWALMRWGMPLPVLLLAWIIWLGPQTTAWHWAAWCVSCTFASASQPALGAAFPAAVAGRALSAYNLVIFGGVFCIQWGVGLLIDALQAQGLAEIDAFRAAFAVFGLCCAGAYAWFLRGGRQAADNG